MVWPREGVAMRMKRNRIKMDMSHIKKIGRRLSTSSRPYPTFLLYLSSTFQNSPQEGAGFILSLDKL